MAECVRTVEEWAEFFRALWDRGIKTLHTSSEYGTINLVSAILQKLKRESPSLQFRHVVKIAEPSFYDGSFDGRRLRAKVFDYIQLLSSDMVHDVQWMWRRGLDDDQHRINEFLSAVDPLAAAVDALKADGVIDRFLCFPYTPDFAIAALQQRFCDGLVVYRNMQEREYDGALDICAKGGRVAYVIRPLNAGKALQGIDIPPRELVKFALDKPSLEGAILSSNSLQHIDAILESPRV